MRRAWIVALLTACQAGSADAPFGDADGGRTQFDVDGAFWDAPFPSDHRVREDTRRVDLTGFPNPGNVALVTQLQALLDDQVQGWSLTGAVWLPVDRAVDPAHLPTLAQSTTEGASVFLVDVDRDSLDVGHRYPIDVVAKEGTDATMPEHAVVALPLQGIPLAPRTRYALVMTRDVFDTDALALSPSRPLATLLNGGRPRGWRQDVVEQYGDAIAALDELGVDLTTIAGLTVFTTGRPTRDLRRVYTEAQYQGGLRVLATPAYQADRVHDDYCVYEGTFDVPNFQSGTPPYTTEGGTFAFDEDGVPQTFSDASCGASVHKGRACGHFTLTVPRGGDVPPEYPVVVFVRTGGGGDKPLLDRGPRTTPGVDVPGSGYAGTFARAGWAAVQFDGPLGGPLRNPEGADEQFLIFNVGNPGGMRDTLRQSAIELALVPALLTRIGVTPSTCPGLVASPQQSLLRFASDDLVLFGHSMGATIAPLAASLQPNYRGLLLSGAGGSWIENVLYKEKPVEVAPLAATMLGIDVDALDAYNPALTLLQWAGEPSDPPLYGDLVRRQDTVDAPHVLMMQGIVDHYIPPPVANALSLSLRLDLAGEALDAAATPQFRSIAELLPLVGARQLALPAGLNVAAMPDRNVTRVLVQHADDGIEDGHEVVFQEAWPHEQVSCFLQGLPGGAPLVPELSVEGAPCPLPPDDEP